MDSSKVAFSVMFPGNAEGGVLPSYVVYKSVHLYNQWIEVGPLSASAFQIDVFKVASSRR